MKIVAKFGWLGVASDKTDPKIPHNAPATAPRALLLHLQCSNMLSLLLQAGRCLGLQAELYDS